MRRVLPLLLVAVLAVLLLTAAAAPAKRVDDCTWGASSVIVENGVQSEPATSGCIPR